MFLSKPSANTLKGLVAKQVGFYSLVCGNLLLSGEHGFYFTKSGLQEAAIVEWALRQMRRQLDQEGLSSAVLLIKDFYPESEEVHSTFQNFNYHLFRILPSMVLNVDPKWRDYSDYLAALSSKYRVRAKKARKVLEAAVHREEMTLADLIAEEDQIQELYQRVADDSGFNVIHLQPGYFTHLKKALGDDLRVTAYRQEDELIGFTTAIRNANGELEAHFLGYDAVANPHFKLYLNMLLDMIEQGIHWGCQHVVFARTAEEIKSSVGAEAVDLQCYIRHRHSFSNRFIKPLLDYLGPEEDDWVPRHPFKAQRVPSLSRENVS